MMLFARISSQIYCWETLPDRKTITVEQTLDYQGGSRIIEKHHNNVIRDYLGNLSKVHIIFNK